VNDMSSVLDLYGQSSFVLIVAHNCNHKSILLYVRVPSLEESDHFMPSKFSFFFFTAINSSDFEAKMGLQF